MAYFIYDEETYPNFFSLCIMDTRNGKKVTYEISDRKNDVKGLIKLLHWLKDRKHTMVGYNSLGFDYPILHLLLTELNINSSGTTLSRLLYEKANEIIEDGKNPFNRWKHKIPEWLYIIKQLDLFVIHHFDNAAKRTSLKLLEFNMRMDNISDLPFEPGYALNNDQKDITLIYGENDVEATFELFNRSVKLISLRKQLNNKYGKELKIDFTNLNDTAVGKKLMIGRLEQSGVKCFEKVEGRKQPIQTHRARIALGVIIADHVEFERPEFNAVKDFLSKQIITQTKGVFSDFKFSELGELAKYVGNIKKGRVARKQKHLPPPKADHEIVDEDETHYHYKTFDSIESLNCIVNGLPYIFGVGGLHASVESCTVEEDEEFCIIDADVESYYPSVIITNEVFPEHLGKKFSKIYIDIRDERRKHDKGTPENAVLKLALNGTYGDLNNQFSALYDPAAMLKVTINGQLSLVMLVEKLLEIKDLEIIQANTDGITFKCRREDRKIADGICSDWENLTGLNLEYAEYKSMIIRDVNNYIAVYTDEDKSPKLKGAFAHKDLELHKNHSSLIIQKSVDAFLTKGENPFEFMKNHEDDFDFFLRAKINRGSELVLRKNEVKNEEPKRKIRGLVIDNSDKPLQRITRYYVSKNGGYLIKKMPPLKDKGTAKREFSINAGCKVTICDQYSPIDKSTIDYKWYAGEMIKLIRPVLSNRPKKLEILYNHLRADKELQSVAPRKRIKFN